VASRMSSVAINSESRGEETYKGRICSLTKPRGNQSAELVSARLSNKPRPQLFNPPVTSNLERAGEDRKGRHVVRSMLPFHLPF